MAEEFAVTATRLQYDGAVIAVREDQVTMPDGTTVDRDIIEHYGAVAIIAVNAENEVAMIRQYRHPIKQYDWEIPAGLLDGPDNESPLMAAHRELIEEIGYTARQWRILVDLAPSPGCIDEVVRVFYAYDLIPVTRPIPIEEEITITLCWLSLSQLREMILRGEIFNGTAVAAILALSILPMDQLRNADDDFILRPKALRVRRGR